MEKTKLTKEQNDLIIDFVKKNYNTDSQAEQIVEDLMDDNLKLENDTEGFIYLIVYKDCNSQEETIEGFVDKREDFKKWLDLHNKGRIEEGEIEEGEHEFEIKEVEKLKWKK